MPEAFQSGQLDLRRWRISHRSRRCCDADEEHSRTGAAIAASVGSSLDRVVSVLVFLRAASDFGAMNDAYRTFWSRDFPTRTTVVVDLSSQDALVEMSIVAAGAGADRTMVHPRDWVQSPSPYSYAMRTGDTVFLSGLVSRNGPRQFGGRRRRRSADPCHPRQRGRAAACRGSVARTHRLVAHLSSRCRLVCAR